MKTEQKNSNSNDTVISIRHLKKSFAGNQVLKDISLDLHKQENLAIMGRSGTGKSVTIKCIVGLMEYDGGRVNVMGKEVSKLDDEELRNMRMKVGFLFQGSALYDSMSVYQNLAFPLTRVMKMKKKSELDKKIDELLENVDLKDAKNKMPADLSGGMRKRVALARTLILEPAIILYDEPTTGLDPVTAKEISELIVNMQQRYKTSSIIITHDLSFARATANRMLFMDQGKFIAEGDYKDLERSDHPLVRSFFNN